MMRSPENVVHVWEDPAAKRIGQTYRKGIEAYQETGRLLVTQKEKMGHGEWLPWLRANETVLGFGFNTAGRLMRWAGDPALEAESVWGNEARNSSSTMNFNPPSDPDETDGPEPAPRRNAETTQSDEPPEDDQGPVMRMVVGVFLMILKEKAPNLSKDQVREVCEQVTMKWRRKS